MERERLVLKGRLSEARLTAKRLRLIIKGDIEAARSKLDPYGHPADIDIETAAEKLLDAYGKQEKLRETETLIKSLKRDLGE